MRFSRRQLHTLQARVNGDRDELAALGIDIASTGVAHNCIRTEFCAADPDRSLQLLTERYGPALRAVWLAGSRTAEIPKAFGSWVADGTQLTMFYGLHHNSERPGRVEFLELTEAVIVTVIVTRVMVGPVTAVGGYRPAHATVELEVPLGKRPVLDAAGSPARRRWPSDQDGQDQPR
jgi:hypothetical protein